MSEAVLVVGRSGTGKSKSAETLPPESTFIINVIGKSLPFKGWKTNYTQLTKDNPMGNMIDTDQPPSIIRTLKYVSENRPEINVIVVDDYQYVMANEYMRRANEVGFKKFVDIGQSSWSLINTARNLRQDLIVIFLTHSDTDFDSDGNKITKAKTIGKMMDNVITLEGMFTVVLYTEIFASEEKRNYYFLTQSSGNNTAKSPEGMFESLKIPNDLQFVVEQMRAYAEA